MSRIKTIILGDSSVGKSTLLTCIREEQNIIPTIGVDCIVHNNLQIWDTSGHKRFKHVVEVFYGKMDMVVFVYRDMDSLAHVEDIRRCVKSQRRKPVKYILVYNGGDDKLRAQGEAYATMYNLKFISGDLIDIEESKNIMDIIEKCGKKNSHDKNGWRYCWFY